MLVSQKDPARVELFSILTLTFLFVRITYKEVNSGNYTETRIVEVYIYRCSPTQRGAVVLVFTISARYNVT